MTLAGHAVAIVKMVTSNKMPDKKVVKMAEQNTAMVVPQKTLLGEVNEHITCPLCHGYYIDATTIVECLHSFCRSCIIKHLQVKSYCPECEMMINSARPNIKPDKALQDIVYKLVPGLFQQEMKRRQQFYSSRPGPAASATPEQRGEDTERVIFSPDDVISFSLEYLDATDADSISSKSSDSNEPQPASATTRRFLQCPAVVNISHLKKFISMKFDIDSTQFAIEILYKRVPMPDYYTLMDIAYIFNWKRNEPMKFFYQIIDYVAIRTRCGLFDINRKDSHFPERKSSPTPTEDTNASSPAPHLNEPGSEMSSGTDSPMPDDCKMKKTSEPLIKQDPGGNIATQSEATNSNKNPSSSQPKKSEDDVEKSQFLNSFELTAKSNCPAIKPVSVKLNRDSVKVPSVEVTGKDTGSVKSQVSPTKSEDSLKRKQPTPPVSSDVKKLKSESDKNTMSANQHSLNSNAVPTVPSQTVKKPENSGKIKADNQVQLPQSSLATTSVTTTSSGSKVPTQAKQNEVKIPQTTAKQQVPESLPIKRPVPGSHGIISPKRKPIDIPSSSAPTKTVSPLKLQVPKTETSTGSKSADTPKHSTKKIPDLKPSAPPSMHNKGQAVGKVRMDLLANNSDPTIDRSKILSQVKTSLGQPLSQSPGQMSGDPLRSLFDSCKINIPSSLSITLTDQKLEQRNQGETVPVDPKKAMVNKNQPTSSGTNPGTHKVPRPPVQNSIEILKLPDSDPKKQQQSKVDNTPSAKPALPSNKPDNGSGPSKPMKSESSAKGPMPSLKPIADTKLGKQSGNFGSPITFQQTFEQQIQTISSDKPKLPKNKMQVPKLMPATPKALSAVNKLNNKPTTANPSGDNKAPIRSDNALDLTTPHNIQSRLSPQQSKAFETMQTMVNLAKKQSMPPKALPLSMTQTQSSVFSGITNRPVSTLASTSTAKPINNGSPSASSPSYAMGSHNSPNTSQASPRSQTRSPSSSPKLVIAEEKNISAASEHSQNMNQSNQITSTQISSANTSKTESPKSSPGPSKQTPKPVKPLVPPGKLAAIRQPISMNDPANYEFIAQHALLRHQMEMQNAWLAAQQRFMSISNQSQSDFNKQNKKQ